MQIHRYANWKSALGRLVVLQLVLALPVLANAESFSNCPHAEAVGADGIRIAFGEHRFADGSINLALSVPMGSEVEIKRVTWGGGEAEGCRYASVALVAGVSDTQWGWHLAWAAGQGVFYARMDGEAWVSSPAKRLSTAGASHVELQVNGQVLRLTWREKHDDQAETHQAVSLDEGRSWEAPVRLQNAD